MELHPVHGALPYFDRQDIADYNIRRILLDDNYLVWSYDGPSDSWVVAIPNDEDEVLRHMVRCIVPKSARGAHVGGYIQRLVKFMDDILFV